MGREIRLVPPNYQHTARNQHGHFKSMFDKTFKQACDEWDAGEAEWLAGTSEESKKYKSKYPHYADWNSARPDNPENYRPWEDSEGTWFQVWETVSEGSPVTPAFATKEELVEYLVKHGDNLQDLEFGTHYAKPWPRKAAEQFVQKEWAPTGMVVGGKMYTAETGFPDNAQTCNE